MHSASIAIIGGGLSGLYAAYRLEQLGLTDYVLIEARSRFGGRIDSPAFPDMTGPHNRFDLGPSWFWPELQPQLMQLIQAMDLEVFEQFEAGAMVIERSPDEAPIRTNGYVNSPPSMRLAGGVASLVEALHRRLDKTRLMTGETVQSLRYRDDHIELDSVDIAHSVTTRKVQRVLLAMPPRLAESTIAFDPPLPEPLARQWRFTPTWMAPHAKYVALYDTPFWREQGLSGEARSLHGPMNEIHDASVPGGAAALFGFFGVPAQVRQTATEATLKAHCRSQLGRLFGPQAAEPRAELFKDWALDPLTATSADRRDGGAHVAAPETEAPSGPWRGRVTGIGSEWSEPFPGYLAGAIDAVTRVVERIPSETQGWT
ncbi:flavin monoamine oxidase family protein [Marinimicrobium koreense]|jgi:monoamine oxidase|uniref:flavin monoamine oxidase family protein n=1 Tax=Marinimicrobium koreense TaxID=306545 RepID=UPI003F6EA76E